MLAFLTFSKLKLGKVANPSDSDSMLLEADQGPLDGWRGGIAYIASIAYYVYIANISHL